MSCPVEFPTALPPALPLALYPALPYPICEFLYRGEGYYLSRPVQAPEILGLQPCEERGALLGSLV